MGTDRRYRYDAVSRLIDSREMRPKSSVHELRACVSETNWASY
jgi:hypothetical protein